MNILDNFKSAFLFSYFWCQTYHNVLDLENQPGSGQILPDPGPQALQGTSDTKSMKTKKKALKIVLNIHTIDFLKSTFV